MSRLPYFSGGGPRGSSKLPFIAAAFLIVSVLFNIISQRQQQGTLPVYNDTEQVTEAGGKENAIDIETDIYADTENGCSASVPKGWTKVTKSGHTTFIQPETGASIQFQVLDYDPKVNSVDEAQISADITEKNMTFISFNRKAAGQYELLYQDKQEICYDYVEEAFWDREKVIKLVGVFDDSIYSDIYPYYDKIISSFAWERKDPIPEGYMLYYIDKGEFEFGCPENWVEGVTTEGVYYASDIESGAMMTISVSDYEGTLDGFVANDMVSLLQGDRQNFMLGSFESDSEKAVGTATYVQNNVVYNDAMCIVSNGVYLYTMIIEYESGTIDDSVPSTCIDLFREFVDTEAYYAEKAAQEAQEGYAEQGQEGYDAPVQEDAGEVIQQ